MRLRGVTPQALRVTTIVLEVTDIVLPVWACVFVDCTTALTKATARGKGRGRARGRGRGGAITKRTVGLMGAARGRAIEMLIDGRY
jgi:hypothetical protein